MHPIGSEREVLVKDALTMGLHGKSASLGSMGGPPNHLEPLGPTKLAANVGSSMKGGRLPSVSMACSNAHPSSFLSVGPSRDVPTLAEGSECPDVRIGDMNPFQAYIVSRGGDVPGLTHRSMHQAKSGVYSHRSYGQHDVPDNLSAMHVAHTVCSTDRATSVYGNEEHHSPLPYEERMPRTSRTALSDSSAYDDDNDEKNAIENDGVDDTATSLAGTAETIPFSMLEPDNPGKRVAEEKSKVQEWYGGWETGNATFGQGSTVRMHSSTYFDDDFHPVPQGNISIFSGDDGMSRADNCTPSPSKLQPYGNSPCGPGSLGVASTFATHSMRSVAPPQGSEMEFSWLVAKRTASYGGTTLTPMGSMSVDEAWNDLFVGGTTVQNGSVTTCLASYDELCMPQNAAAPRSEASESECPENESNCSTKNTTNLASTPRGDGDVSSRWSLSDDGEELEDAVFDEPTTLVPREYPLDVAHQEQFPLHLLPYGMNKEVRIRPTIGEKVMNAFYTSHPRMQSDRHQRLYRQNPHPIISEPAGDAHSTVHHFQSTPTRPRFSVFLETGYPGVPKVVKAHPYVMTPRTPAHRTSSYRMPIYQASTPMEDKPKRRWRPLHSVFSALFGCFKYEIKTPRLPTLENISELPQGYVEYCQGGGKYPRGLYNLVQYDPETVMHLTVDTPEGASSYIEFSPRRRLSRRNHTW